MMALIYESVQLCMEVCAYLSAILLIPWKNSFFPLKSVINFFAHPQCSI